MSGIGFLLRKLSKQDNYLGVLRAYYHSTVAAVGPWILVALTLSAIIYFTTEHVQLPFLEEFLSVIVYNLLFSFVLSAPIYMISARYVSDCLFRRNGAPIVGVFVYGQWYIVLPALIIGIPFYIFYAKMNPTEIFLSIVNFVLFAEIWFVMLFLSSIRNFRAITLSWVIGTLIAILLGIYLGRKYQFPGMLFGITTGLAVLLYSLMANILAEYPYRYTPPRNYKFYFKNYKQLALSGLFLFSGLWVDKVIMWCTPEATIHLNHLRTYPIYDGAMFYSYLSIVPVMGLFIFGLEANFFDSYYDYLKNLEFNSPFSSLEKSRKNMLVQITESGRDFLVLQGSISFVIILLSPTLFEWLSLSFAQLGIFRLGAVGAFFSALNFFIVIIFSYFDSQGNMLAVSLFMFLSNAIFTLMTIALGFSFYGYGFAFSMILTFLFGALMLIRFLDQLHYKIFISNVVKRTRFKGKELIAPEQRGVS